tara:strand:- start:129 stop:317 length:189 start_codon:yes stop_codon:yes gene_type:complete
MKRNKGRKWDGKSRVSNDLYRKNWDEIFKKRVMEGKDPFKVEVKKEPISKEELKKIIDRNGF